MIEKILIEAQEKVLQKRMEITKYIRQNEEQLLNNLPNQAFSPVPNQLQQPIQETKNSMQKPHINKQKRPAEVIDLESDEEPRKQNNFEIEVNFSNSDKKQKKAKKSVKKSKAEKPFACHKCDKRLSTKGSLIKHTAIQHGELLNKNQELETVEGM